MRTLPWWTLFFLVPLYGVFSALTAAQPWKNRELPVMVLISCCSYGANRVGNFVLAALFSRTHTRPGYQLGDTLPRRCFERRRGVHYRVRQTPPGEREGSEALQYSRAFVFKGLPRHRVHRHVQRYRFSGSWCHHCNGRICREL